MKPIADLPYPSHELPHLEKLKQLFEDWHARFDEAASQLEKHQPDDIVCDGFYPHYFDQPKRILFVGRESRQISGFNSLELIHASYRSSKKIGGRPLNTNKVHSRMLYLAYGLLNGMPDWRDIPYADEIGDTFATEQGISFACMNLSKLSNEADDWQSDWPAIEMAYRLSNEPRRLSEEEVVILQPDLVITMNLGDKLEALGSFDPLETGGSVTTGWLHSGGHRSLLIDTFHFSAWNKDDVRDFYLPVCEAVKRHLGD